MSTRGLFWLGYALVVALLVTFWASHVLHTTIGQPFDGRTTVWTPDGQHTVAPTLHRVCAVYACTQSDTDTTGGNR